jgi:hypothetical protein
MFVITDWDLRAAHSSAVNTKAKSSGKRFRFLHTAWLRTRTSTPYNAAKSAAGPRRGRWMAGLSSRGLLAVKPSERRSPKDLVKREER